MYFSKLSDKENPDDFKKIVIENRVFYCLKPVDPSSKIIKRRYSDQFKDALFIAKDTYRKLKMIQQFNLKYRDITKQTEKYISCVEEAICVLKGDFSIDPKAIFKSFNLKSLGINPEDYGIDEEEINENIGEENDICED